MPESLFSTYWYRVANLKPVLRDATIIYRHVYRGQPWYVLKNSLSGRNHRFNATGYVLIGQMDGQRTVQEIWENAGKLSVAAAPTQDEVIYLLGRLHDADLIQSDILPSTVELFRQAQGQPSNSLKQRISNPFSLRFPFWDPDRFLKKWCFLAAPLFTRGAFILWLLVVLSAVAAAVSATRSSVSEADLEAAGLASRRRTGRGIYDRFRARVIFPIRDASGGATGMTGRILGAQGEDTGPKYLNTPQTMLFDKGRTLFLIDKAKSAIRKSGVAVLVEGAEKAPFYAIM